MADFNLRIYKSFGGRANRGQWSNSYLIRTDELLDSAGILTLAQKFVDFEKAIHTDAVYFMRMVLSTVAHEAPGATPPPFRTIELDGKGLRVAAAAAANVLALDVALAYKKQGTLGRAGLELYRGALIEEDVQGGGNGEFLFSPASDAVAFGNQAANALIDGLEPGEFILDDTSDGESAGAREVTALKLSAVIVKKKTNRRKKQAASTTNQANGALATAGALLGGALAFYLTKNPATAMSAAQKVAVVTGSAQLGGLAGQLAEWVENNISIVP